MKSDFVRVQYEGQSIIVRRGRAFFRAAGYTLLKEWAPENDAELQAAKDDWSDRRDRWGNNCKPYEIIALTTAQVAALIADTEAKAVA